MMTDPRQRDEMIRKYLLRELSDEECQKVEQQMMTDTDFYNQILLAEDELVEEYVAGELSAKDTERFKASFLCTPEGRQQVELARDLIEYRPSRTKKAARAGSSCNIQVPWWKLSPATSYTGIALAVILVIGMGLVIWRVFIYQSDLEKGIALLRSNYQDHRRIEARLTGFNYSPLVTSRAGDQNIDSPSRRRAEIILLNEVAENPSAASYAALGQFYLTERKFDNAIKGLGEGLNIDPTNARLYSDIGAALLEKGKEELSKGDSGKSIESFNRSLGYLNAALRLDDTLLEALFNRALLFQEMKLPTQAEEDWREYLKKDPGSRWKDEATQKLKSLEEKRNKDSQSKQQPFKDFLHTYETKNDERAWVALRNACDVKGNTIVSHLLDEFLEASINRQQDKEQVSLQMLSYIGALEAQKTGDRFTQDLALYYRLTSPQQRRVIARARKFLSSGHEFFFTGRIKEAFPYYSQAKQIFERCGDHSESAMADYWLHHCLSLQHKEKQGLPLLYRLDKECESKSYKWLRVRSLYGLSGVHFNLNDPSKAIAYGKEALRLAEEINDADGALKATIPIIEYYRYLGNYDQCLSSIGLSLSFDSLEPIQAWRHHWVMSLSFYYFGFYDAAVEYQKDALRLAASLDNKSAFSVSYANLAMIYGKIEDYDQASRNAQLALETAESISEGPIRLDNMAYSYLQMGNIYKQAGDYNNAIASYNNSIELYNRLSFSTHLYQAHKGRLFCYIQNKDDSLADEAIGTAFDLLEKYRSKISEDDDRNSFFDVEQSTYDLAIDFESSRMNNSQKAFEYSEKSRARSLLYLLGPNALGIAQNGDQIISVSSPLALADIQAGMPEQAQILQYTLLTNKLLIWVITKSSFEAVEVDITQKRLTEKVLRYLQLISMLSEAKKDETRLQAAGLFDLLIKPVEPLLEKNKQICIVPDKVLNSLPFVALVSPSSGRYLIEDYLVTSAQSSSIFVVCSRIASKKEKAGNERILSVGDPRFDHDQFPTLANLPSAKTEAEEVVSYYNMSYCLMEEAARKDQVKSEMEKANVIHLALHSKVDEISPHHSKLIFAKEPSNSSLEKGAKEVLEESEIYSLKLQRVRLVVLSGCKTGASRYYGGEGMISFARPFIAKGVPVVIASFWLVETESTTDLMISFHKHRKRDGLSTAESLRRAQLEMLHDSAGRFRHPYYWAAFTVIGGYSNF
jgi:CHAT domain-containing protein/cytochrome c-type biogenesis protein CcmH/NrfG